MSSQNKSNLQLLRAEQSLLRIKCKEKEEIFNDKLNHLEKHFGGMVLNSVLPFNEEQRNKVNSSLDTINTFIAGIIPGSSDKDSQLMRVLKVVQMLAAGFVYKNLRKMFK